MFDQFSNQHEITPTAMLDEKVRADAARVGHVAGAPVHLSRRNPATTPGAYNYAYDMLNLYEQNICGPGYCVRKMPKVFEGTNWLATQGILDVGFGGLVAGNFVMQPLYDPASNSYGGYPLVS